MKSILAVAVLAVLAVPAASQEISVHVTDHVQTSGLSEAKEYATRVFAEAGVTLVWDADNGSKTTFQLFVVRTSPGSVMGKAAVRDGQAWIFRNRVNTLAGQKAMDERVLLGRAIVHEIGHLLSLNHSSSTIMRAEIYTELMEGKFAFTSNETLTIRKAIAQ